MSSLIFALCPVVESETISPNYSSQIRNLHRYYYLIPLKMFCDAEYFHEKTSCVSMNMSATGLTVYILNAAKDMMQRYMTFFYLIVKFVFKHQLTTNEKA